MDYMVTIGDTRTFVQNATGVFQALTEASLRVRGTDFAQRIEVVVVPNHIKVPKA